MRIPFAGGLLTLARELSPWSLPHPSERAGLSPVQNSDTLFEHPRYCHMVNSWFAFARKHERADLIEWAHRFLCSVAYGIDVGGGLVRSKLWHSLDLETGVDLVRTDFSFIADRSLRRIMSHHFIEHISEQDLVHLLSALKPKMASDCVFRIACPDAFDRQNRRTLMDHGHVEAWHHKRITELAERLGFRIDLLQYCDEEGNYVVEQTLFDLGHIDSHTLITPYGRFKILRGLGRYNVAKGQITEEHSLFFDLRPK